MDYKKMKPIRLVRQMLIDGVITQEQAEKYFPELAEIEDERIRKELLSFFTERAKHVEDSTFNCLSSKEIITWFEKQGEKKPVWWRNEDEDMLNQILHYLDFATIYSHTDSALIDDCKHWLKSLRPQKQWKPTEEQLEALNSLLLKGEITKIGQAPCLQSLYNDLKAL